MSIYELYLGFSKNVTQAVELHSADGTAVLDFTAVFMAALIDTHIPSQAAKNILVSKISSDFNVNPH